MAPPHNSSPSFKRRAREFPTGGSVGLSVLGGVVVLVFIICFFRLGVLLVATSGGFPQQRSQGEMGQLSEVHPRFIIEDDGADRVHDQADRDVIPSILDERLRNSSRRALQDNGPYHSRNVFFQDYQAMAKSFKVFVYPVSKLDRFKHIFLPVEREPSGNYASESYFKTALWKSGMVTKDPAKAHFFFMPFSITRMRNDPDVGVGRIQSFIEDYMRTIVHEWPYWNRTGGADHFYVACHSLSRSALDRVDFAQLNAIQVVCSSSYFLRRFIPHKDVPLPQIWPRQEEHPHVQSTRQRSTLAFYAGGANSPVRAKVVETWKKDGALRVYGSRIPTSYSEALLSSKFCLHVKGYEVNTARLADALFHGCVPVVIANHYELPFDSVLNWSKFSVILTTKDIPKLKDVLLKISDREYREMHNLVLQVRRHFQWHSPPQEHDAFFMVMYQLWRRRHILRYNFQ